MSDARSDLARNTLGVLFIGGLILAAFWVLRPFIGAPDIPTRFFREDAWSNAYVAVAEKVWGAFGGNGGYGR